MGKVAGLTTLNILVATSTMSMFLHCSFSKMSDFCLGNASILFVPADFTCKTIVPKNGLHCKIKLPSHHLLFSFFMMFVLFICLFVVLVSFLL